MRRSLPSLFMWGMLMLPHAAGAASPVVLELFTSQGCSACPPADALLQSLAGNSGVLALSFHVDYWDGLDWRDPFSLPAATERQLLYRRALEQKYLFTPELVVDGARGLVGSRKDEVLAAIGSAAATVKPVTVTLTPGSEGNHMSITLAGSLPPETIEGGIWLVTYSPKAVTAVRGGENKGTEMTSVNNVTSVTRLAALSDPLPPTLEAEMSAPADNGYAVLVQAKSGAVLGAGSYLPNALK